MEPIPNDATPSAVSVPGLVAFGLVLFAGAWWSIHLAAGPSGFSMLWLPSGMLFGVLLTSPPRQWRGLLAVALLAFVAANLRRNGLSVLTLVLGLCNLLDAWLAARITAPRVKDAGQLATIGRTLRVAGVATLFACTLSALAAATARRLLSPHAPAFADLFETWLASHAIGMVIFGALAVITRIEGRRMLGPPARRLELAGTLLLITACAWLVFGQDSLSVSFALIPLLLFCVLRHRFSGFVPAVAVIALVATMQTAAGQGPFNLGTALADGSARVRLLQLYLLSCCFSAFPVASVLTEHRILAHRVRRSEQLYRMLTDHSRDLIIRIRADRSFDYISPSVVGLLGWTADEFERMRWNLVHPEDVTALRQSMATLLENGGTESLLYRCRHRQGNYLWLAANVHGVQDAGGERHLIYSGRDVTLRVEAEQALKLQARRDPLTGLANRLLFDERMALALARAKRNKTRVGLLYCDIDHFKAINDTHGHAIGDLALRVFAQRLGECIRAVDLAARLGGDEFVVLVEDLTTPAPLRRIADGLLAAMQEPVESGSGQLQITTSIGLGMTAAAGSDAAELMQLADRALYAAKHAGRNSWRLAVAAGPQDSQSGA